MTTILYERDLIIERDEEDQTASISQDRGSIDLSRMAVSLPARVAESIIVPISGTRPARFFLLAGVAVSAKRSFSPCPTRIFCASTIF